MLKKNNRPPQPTDDIPEGIHKRLHIIYFILKCVFGAMIFLLFYNRLCILFLNVPEFDHEDSPFLRHEYCGTFFVEINRENSFASDADYQAYLDKQTYTSEEPTVSAGVIAANAAGLGLLIALLVLRLKKSKPAFIENRFVVFAVIYAALCLLFLDFMYPLTHLLYICLILALRSGDKKTIFRKRASDYFLIGGGMWLTGNIITEIADFNELSASAEFMSGPFAHPKYYLQLYDTAVIPIITICAGLMLRRRELELKKADTSRNSAALKGAGGALIVGTGAFVLYRLGVRVYELIRVMTGSGYTVRLPFTVMDISEAKYIDLPPELAKTPRDYRNVVLFRFVKDLPVFVLSALAVLCFVKMLLAVSKGELNTVRNRKRLYTAMLLLTAASLWFNLMGIPELSLFNNGFTGIYGEVVYTIALRSKTEPLLYVLVLWFFKTYLQTIPEREVQVRENGTVGNML